MEKICLLAIIAQAVAHIIAIIARRRSRRPGRYWREFDPAKHDIVIGV